MDAATSVQHSNPMHRFRHRYGKALEWVVGTLMIILAIEVTVGVIFRWFGNSLVWYDETASLLLAWLTFYGSALASVRRAHIGCPEVVESLGPRCRRYFNIRSEEHTSELQSLMRISYAVFCLKKKKT